MDSNNLNQINMDDVTKGDDADVSAYSTLMTVEEGLKNIRVKSAIQNQEGFSMFDGVTCVDCGEDLLKHRLEVPSIRCEACQTDLEKRQKMFNR